MLGSKCLFLCISYLMLGARANSVPFVTPCKWQDKECILKSAVATLPHLVKGMPEFKIPPADPLPLGDVVADSGTLKLSFHKGEVVGISKCTITDIFRTETGGSLALDCPIRITGQYVMDGTLVYIPAQGKGDFEIKTEKISILIDWKQKAFTGKDGKKHYKVSSFDYKYVPVERIYIILENLFNGNKKLAEPVLTMLNDSWKTIVADLGGPLFKAILSQAVHIVDLFFRNIAAEELEIA